MSIEISIKNKSDKNEIPSISYITNDIFKYGSFDGTRLNINEKGPDGSISMFNPNHIGRSISVDFGKNEINLYLPLPTSAEDIDDFYETAKRVADFWNGEVDASQDGQPFDPYNSKQYSDDAKETSLIVLQQIIKGEFKAPVLYCALWAIYLDDRDIKELSNGDGLNALRDFMHKMQNIDAYYARPNFYQTKYSDTIFGIYVFSEGVVSIVPNAPRLPLGFGNLQSGKSISVEDWYVCLYSDTEEKILGHVMYDDFLKALKPDDYYHYDASNILLKGLTKERIDFMLKKFGVSPP